MGNNNSNKIARRPILIYPLLLRPSVTAFYLRVFVARMKLVFADKLSEQGDELINMSSFCAATRTSRCSSAAITRQTYLCSQFAPCMYLAKNAQRIPIQAWASLRSPRHKVPHVCRLLSPSIINKWARLPPIALVFVTAHVAANVRQGTPETSNNRVAVAPARHCRDFRFFHAKAMCARR